MILRGASGKGDQDFSGNMVNMETVQMIRIVSNFNGINTFRIIAYVNTGASITGPIGVVLNHPATKTERAKKTATTGNSKSISFSSNSNAGVSLVSTTVPNNNYKDTKKGNIGYGVSLVKESDKSGYYDSRNTDNLYLMRQILGSLNDNITRSVNGIITAIGALNSNFIQYKNDSRSYYSGSMSKNTNISIDNSSDSELKDWPWFKGNVVTEDNKPTLDNILKYKPKATDKKLYGFIDERNVMSNGIEIIALGEYNSKDAAMAEFNKIQREYSKYVRGDLSCFNPPKVYQLSRSSIEKENIKSGNPYDKVKGAAYRFTTEVYESSDGRIIADCGWYINDNYWLRAGVDYDIDFPKLRNGNEGTLRYRFKGQYNHLGVENIPVALKG